VSSVDCGHWYVAYLLTVQRDQVRDPLSGRAVVQAVADSYVADMQLNGGNSHGRACRLADGAVVGVSVTSRGAATWFSNGESAQTDK
jgi:hypothetical protein